MKTIEFYVVLPENAIPNFVYSGQTSLPYNTPDGGWKVVKYILPIPDGLMKEEDIEIVVKQKGEIL